MDSAGKGGHKAANGIAKDIKNRLFYLLFFNQFEGIINGHHIIGDDPSWPQLRWIDGKTIHIFIS